jgi:hypothetical protein
MMLPKTDVQGLLDYIRNVIVSGEKSGYRYKHCDNT